MSAPELVAGHTILTASGGMYDLADPASWDGSIDAIAQGLANTCRYGGQVPRFFSVAEHSVLVAYLVAAAGGSNVVQLAGLLHDAHEAFYGDFVRPLKPLLGPQVASLTALFDRILEERLGLEPDALHHQAVKDADDRALRMEAGVLWGHRAPAWAIPPDGHSEAVVIGMDPDEARRLFRFTFDNLMAATRAQRPTAVL